ncbi:MAG: hypothetical protein C4339_04570 [Nitrososphaerota archaeon]
MFARLRLPTVAAQILAGMLVGPFGLGWIRNTGVIAQMAGLGVTLLLFTIGVELDPLVMRRLLGKVLALTAAEMAIALALGLIEGMTFSLLGLMVLGRSWPGRHR